MPQARRDLWLPLVERDFGGDEVHTTRIPFRIPERWQERTLLRFGAVDWRATVTLDGFELGVHEGGYTHFTFDAGLPLRIAYARQTDEPCEGYVLGAVQLFGYPAELFPITRQ